VRRALELARHAYGERICPSGQRCLAQPMAVAALLDELNLDHETLAAGLLWRAVEEGLVETERVRSELGEAVAALVDGVLRMGQIQDLKEPETDRRRDAVRLEGLRKLLLAMAEDLRVVMIRLAGRLHELRSLRSASAPERQRLARETLDIYAPLANRLGIWQIKWELEDYAFRYLEPQRYQALVRQLDERRDDRERYIGEAIRRLQAALASAGVHAEVSGRPKHLYSIFKKMQRKGVDLHEVFDVRAVRILVDSLKDCYAALGVVHGMWPYLPKEFDDYIANPKGNDYRSLHTAVIGPGGHPLEVQIRTHEMHRQAELGVAAHWRYKEGGADDPHFQDRIAWLRQLLELKDESSGAEDFLERFKTEVFHDRVYALTPKGRVVDLPRGATPLDFAYAVHTEIGHRCRGAKLKGSIVPLTYELKNGDQVEIITVRHGGPSRDWLNPSLGYLKTPRAQGKVRQWFKQQDYEKNLSAGRDILERELKRLGAGEVGLEKLAVRLKIARVEDMLAALGRGELGCSHIANALKDEVLPASRHLPGTRPRLRRSSGPLGDVTIAGVGNLMTQLARCCKPAPPDPITGYVTQGRGVTIHRKDCPNSLRLGVMDPSRVMEVAWSAELEGTYQVDIAVQAYDRQGLLRDISQVLANEKVNVLGVNTLTDRDTRIASMRFTVEVPDVGKLSRVLSRVAQLPNVTEVHRRK
jgi:GTP pyrophosphokinase